MTTYKLKTTFLIYYDNFQTKNYHNCFLYVDVCMVCFFRLPPSNRLRVYVIESYALQTVSIVIGWIYFVAWTLASYPQLVLNYRRKR